MPEPIHETTVGAYDVRVVIDTHPVNPLEDFDTLSPMVYFLTTSGLDTHESGCAVDLETPFDSLTPAQVSARWRDLARAVEVSDLESFDSDCRERAADYDEPLGEARRVLLAESLADMAPTACDGINTARDYLAALATVWRAAGVPAVVQEKRDGYDVAAAVLIALPEFLRRVGVDAAGLKLDSLEGWGGGDFDTVAAYWLGNCYGWEVELGGEHVDSCWGYYGESDYALACGVESAAAHVARDSHARTAKLKALVRARVPLAKRRHILESIDVPA